MTFAPEQLRKLQAYWVDQHGVPLGIVGDSAHRTKGTSYHLGKGNLLAGAYSARTARDKNGLSEAAAAIDLGRLNGSLEQLWKFSMWFALQCKSGKSTYNDVREVIFWDPETQTVLGWSDLSSVRLIPGYGDMSHKTHTHISFYRDSESRDKTKMFTPYFEQAKPPPEEDMGPTFITQGQSIGVATTIHDVSIIATADGQFYPTKTGYVRNVIDVVKITDGTYKGETAYLVALPGGVEMGLLLADHATYVADLPPDTGDCQTEVQEAVSARDKEWEAWAMEGSPGS